MINKSIKKIILIVLCFSMHIIAFTQTVEIIANKNNVYGYYGDNYAALDANSNLPSAQVYDSYGNLFVVDKQNKVTDVTQFFSQKTL